MLAKVRDKRIELFKKAFPDYTVSKNGNFVAEINPRKVDQTIIHNGFNTTKGLIDKVGTKTVFSKNQPDMVLLMTKEGKFMVKKDGRYFKSFTMTDLKKSYFTPLTPSEQINFNSYNESIIHILAPIFFVGRKYEYLLHHKELWAYRLFQNFNSLKEAKVFLGMPFISDEDFTSIFKMSNKSSEDGDNLQPVPFNSNFDYITPIVLAKDKVKAYRLLRNIDSNLKDTLSDYIEMCKNNGFEVEIPAGKNRLIKLHEEVSAKIAEKNAENYSKEVAYEVKVPEVKNNFIDFWKKYGLQFKRLETPYDMYLQGCKQKHCIGSNYYNKLGICSFYTISWEGQEYDIQVRTDGMIGQMYGRRNSNPPQQLAEIVRDPKCNYKHKIIEIEGVDFTTYPLINQKSAELNDFIW